MLDAQQADVLVVDYVMPGGKYGDGLVLLSFLQRRYPALHLVTITMIDNPSVLHAIQRQGVGCILSKSDAISHLVGAVHAAYVGANYVSSRRQAIADLHRSADRRADADGARDRGRAVVRGRADGG